MQEEVEARRRLVEASRAGDSREYVRARAALRVAEAHKTTVIFNEQLHPRNSLGRFVHVLGALKVSIHGSAVRTRSGNYVTYKFGRYRLHEKGGRVIAKSRDPYKIAERTARAEPVFGLKSRYKFEYDTDPPTLLSVRTRRFEHPGTESGLLSIRR